MKRSSEDCSTYLLTMVEKLLTNWMSICLYSYLREVAGEPLYMLFRAIKYQVDKGPVDAITGKAKRTLNDSRLLREDVEYRPLTLTVLVRGGPGGGAETQRIPARVLDTDTITQVKEKILDQVFKGVPFSQRPSVMALRGPDFSHAEPVEEAQHVATLQGTGTLQKFVDDVFQAVLSVNRPVPIAVKYLFDQLDELATKHGVTEPETLHIWKTNSLLLRFWVNTLKNPQFIFDVRVSDNVDANLTVIAQTFIDACTTAEHKVGRVSLHMCA
uniref:Uncharacterized protein n=1 Tax=Naja naja TaxID=35670 RepID=A0A8C6YJB6_NAJNA